MACECSFRCPLPNGLHARPASLFSAVAKRFTSELTLINERTGAKANAKSVLALVGADVKFGDGCRVGVEGVDQDKARAAIQDFVERVLPGCDEALPLAGEKAGEVLLPRSIIAAGVRWIAGTPACGGIGRGVAVGVAELALPEEAAGLAGESVAVERARIEQGLAAVRKAIAVKSGGAVATIEKAILEAHLSIVDDVALRDKLVELVEGGCSAGGAIVGAGRHFMEQLRGAESLYVRERAADVQDVCLQLVEEVCGPDWRPGEVKLTRASVVVAENLTPRQLLALDRQLLRGLALGHAGTTSHAIILARSFGIPTLTGIRDAWSQIAVGQEVVVDAETGIVVAELTPAVERYYEREAETIRRHRKRTAVCAACGATTKDGRRVEVAANVSTAAEVGPAMEQGAEGIGLFRTEMLFLDRKEPPSEEEQFAEYAQAARAAGGRPVIIRTMDIGGDKPAAYLGLPAEANPFLGYRGVRIYPQHEWLFVEQVRAIVRASAFGAVRLMVPMIALPEEARWVRQRVTEVQAELKPREAAFDERMQIGAMIEVPSAAYVLDRLAEHLDFFSIGTNDLAQYFFAADRGNAKVAGLHDVRHPAFLRLLRRIVEEARGLGKWVGLCGEMSRDAMNLPLLIGLGLEEISLSAPDVPAIKAAVGRLSAGECGELLKRAMDCATGADVAALLGESQRQGHGGALLDCELVDLDADCANREEAIRRAVDALYLAGRTQNRRAVEEAVWAREAVYSTGLGFGFAIPHCKTDAIGVDSICVLRFREPVDWGAEDGQPVRMAILLAIRESNQDGTHMKVLAQLARRLMHEEFREGLMTTADADAVVQYLSQELGLAS